MKSIILHILCEGATENSFVNRVLSPYLQEFGIYPKSDIFTTSRKKNVKGGVVSYIKVKNELELLFKQYRKNEHEVHLFTTMLDYYALPNDFPGFEESIKIQDVRKRIDFIENEFRNDIGKDFFIPYIQLHEFEALLFVDIEKLKSEYPLSEKGINGLMDVANKIGDPELINNSYETSPSKRIMKAIEDKYRYNKVQTGTKVTASIGIERLIASCQHFHGWIAKIEEKSIEICK